MKCDDLLVNSNVALSRIKSSGRDNYGFYSQELSVSSLEVLTIEQHLRKAIGTSQLYAVYQPKYNLVENKLIGFEVLARWRSPELGEVSPARFIPIAEDSGLILKIGEWIMKESCKQNSEWISRGIFDVPVSVNVSALQFRHNNFVEMVEHILHTCGLSPDRLELELTETVVADDPKSLSEKLKRLDQMQVLMALDDFGTGYSSMSYLRSLPIRRIKIDQSFVSDLPQNNDSVAIASAIVGMAISLGMKVIAEGVENQEQADFLKSIGCFEVQGYLYGRPMLPNEAEACPIKLH